MKVDRWVRDVVSSRRHDGRRAITAVDLRCVSQGRMRPSSNRRKISRKFTSVPGRIESCHSVVLGNPSKRFRMHSSCLQNSGMVSGDQVRGLWANPILPCSQFAMAAGRVDMGKLPPCVLSARSSVEGPHVSFRRCSRSKPNGRGTSR